MAKETSVIKNKATVATICRTGRTEMTFFQIRITEVAGETLSLDCMGKNTIP